MAFFGNLTTYCFKIDNVNNFIEHIKIWYNMLSIKASVKLNSKIL